MNSVVTICEAKPEHEAGWRVLWDLYCDGGISAEVTDATWRRILDPVSTIGAIVAVVDCKVVGFITYVEHEGTWEKKKLCYVEDLYIDKRYRGDKLGVGLSMAKAMTNRLESGEWARLYGITRSDNVIAQRLYGQFTKGEPYIRYIIKGIA